jgi:hypothetical protein
LLHGFVQDLYLLASTGDLVKRVRWKLGRFVPILFCNQAFDLFGPFSLLLDFRQKLLLEIVFF